MEIEDKHLMDLIFWARRYCDGRYTYAPSEFNKIYANILTKYPELVKSFDHPDKSLMDNGIYWPFAQDGNYDRDTGELDARPF